MFSKKVDGTSAEPGGVTTCNTFRKAIQQLAAAKYDPLIDIYAIILVLGSCWTGYVTTSAGASPFYTSSPSQPASYAKKQSKKQNKKVDALKSSFFLIISIYLIIYSILVVDLAEATITNFANSNSHHVIFDDLGKLSTGVTYINVAIPLNLTNYETQINLFDTYLDSINNKLPIPTSPDTSFSNITIHNIQSLFKSISSYAQNRLKTLKRQLITIDDLLPYDESFDLNNDRHKRFVFMIPMIICEVNKAHMHCVKV